MTPPRIIPLIEDVPGLVNAKNIIGNTILAYQEQLNETPQQYRVFMGKSDSALPFRGHVTLENADNFFNEHRGIDTVTLQSGIRYDHEKGLSKPAHSFSDEEKEEFINIIGIFGARYNRSIQQFSSIVSRIADFLPHQRDRLMRGGSTGYARDAPNAASVIDLCSQDIGKELALLKTVNEDVDIIRDIFDLETQCNPTYRTLLEMVQITQSTLIKMGKMRRSLG